MGKNLDEFSRVNLLWTLTLRDVGSVERSATESFGLVLWRWYGIILYLQAETIWFPSNHRVKIISISSTGHRTDNIHSLGGNPDTECSTQKASYLST